MLENIEHNK